MAIAGLDIGTTGAKLTVFTVDGRLLHRDNLAYPVARHASGQEVHAGDIWSVVKLLLGKAAAAVPDLTAVGVTSFGESFVLLGKEDEVLLPSMLYTDPHGGEEAEELRSKLGDDRIYAITGSRAHSMYSLPKLLWIKKHHPESFAAARHVCLIADFITYKLTGRRIIDYSLAARTMAFDIRQKAWSAEIFAAAGIDPALFSQPLPSGSPAGSIRPEVAVELGLSPHLQVVNCCHDQVAAAVGSNVMQPGLATDGAGTTECITPIFSSMPEGRSLRDNNYTVVPFLRADTYCLYAFTPAGGALIKWYVDTLAGYEKAEAKARGISVYDRLENAVTLDEPTGILVLPHFAGAGTPTLDTGSKGAILGLQLTHTGSDLYRACLEGVAYEMAFNLEKLAEAGICPHLLRATGGGAKSRLWLQLKADILNLPVERMSVDEAGTVGDIMLTGVATGAYASLDEAAQLLVKPVEVFSPRAEVHAKYRQAYERYRLLYAAVRPLV